MNTVSQIVVNLAWMIGIGWRTERASFVWRDREINFSLLPKAQEFAVETSLVEDEKKSWLLAKSAAKLLDRLLTENPDCQSVALSFSRTTPLVFSWSIKTSWDRI